MSEESAGETQPVTKDAKEASLQNKSENDASAVKTMDLVPLGKEVMVDPAKRLSKYDKGKIKAYGAVGSGRMNGHSLIAYICDKSLPPRFQAALQFKSMNSPGVFKLADEGVIKWFDDKQKKAERYAIAYHLNFMDRVATKEQESGLGWRSEDVMNRVIASIVPTLKEFRDLDFIHGSIRASNLFHTNEGGQKRVMLGDCLTMPPSFAQPIQYLTIERSMADGTARGLGTHADDMYAFGVTLAVLLRNYDPLEGLSTEEIIGRKLEEGSYAAITGQDRFTGAILELLRGLLYDDPNQRWDIENVLAWLDGQRLTPKQTVKRKKAARPLLFNNKKFFRPEMLALEMLKRPSEVATILESGQMQNWIERSLSSEALLTSVEEAMEAAKEQGKGDGYWDRLACRVSIALHPEAPVRYMGTSIHPEGLGNALVSSMLNKKSPKPYTDLINQNIFLYWMNMQPQLNVDASSLMVQLDTCRAFIRQQHIGFGVERCIYYLNEEVPCLSPVFDNHFVRTPEDLLEALSDIAPTNPRPEIVFDRHTVAFLAARESRSVEPYLPDLRAEEKYRQNFAILKILATLQKKAAVKSLPEISQWMGKILDSVYHRFHDRELRVKLKKTMEKHILSGDLLKMAGLLDNLELQKQDAIAFQRAMHDYQTYRQENASLEDKLSRPGIIGRQAGREMGAVVSGIIAGIVILAVAFVTLNNGAMF